jgi:hypothetical protein
MKFFNFFFFVVALTMLTTLSANGQITPEGAVEDPVVYPDDPVVYPAEGANLYVTLSRRILTNYHVVECHMIAEAVCVYKVATNDPGMFGTVFAVDSATQTEDLIPLSIGNGGQFDYTFEGDTLACMPIPEVELFKGDKIRKGIAASIGTQLWVQDENPENPAMIVRSTSAWDPAGGIPLDVDGEFKEDPLAENPNKEFQIFLLGKAFGPIGPYVHNACNYMPTAELHVDPDFTCYTLPFTEEWNRRRMIDHDNSGIVDEPDLFYLLTNFAAVCSLPRCVTDYNGDGETNSGDLGALLGEYGNTVP